MSTNAPEECEDLMVDLMSNFSMGVGLLMVLAEPNDTIGSREETLETFAAFDAAYGSLAAQTGRTLELSTSKHTVTVRLSDEILARVKRLGALLHLAPESPEAEGAAAEIRALAAECLQMLAPGMAGPGESAKPTQGIT